MNKKLKYNFKILTEPNSINWNNGLLKNEYASYFQTSEYITSISKEKQIPVFIHVIDENENIVGQLGIQIIKTTALYSSSLANKFQKLISKIMVRGNWVFGPIIHSKNKETHHEILQLLIEAIDTVIRKYDLVHIEGYSPPYDPFVDENYLELFKKNGYIVKPFVTFIADMKKNIDELWSNVHHSARGDVKRAKRRNVTVKELENIDELKSYLLLHQEWAKTKGLTISQPFSELDNLWNNFQKGLENFFLAYQDGKLISALRVSCFNRMAYANFILSSYSNATSVGGPALSWYAVEWAKKNDIRLYDFSGGPKLEENSKENNVKTLLYYKKKWGGDEFIYYNFIKSSKKLSYVLYRLLFNLTKSYYNFTSKSRST